MYAFKVVVSTIIMIMMLFMMYAWYKSEASGRMAAALVFFVYALGLIAIWG